METKDKIFKERVEREFTIAENETTGRRIFACPDDMWQIALGAHARCGEIPEPFPEGHIIFEGKSTQWKIIAGQTVFRLCYH